MNKKVQDYYDYTMNFYKVFWHGETRGLHYGVWDESTKNLQESILNTNQLICDLAQFKDGQKVLDAGCGVGGSVFYIKKKFNVDIEGITISEKQIGKANELKQRYGIKDTTFSLQSFIHTNFQDNTFDVVYSVESVCHAEDKNDFLKEAYRILKPGGKLVMWDGFLEKEGLNETENKMYLSFLRGFALDNLSYYKTFGDDLLKNNFKNIKTEDYTDKVGKTALRMWLLSVLVGIPTTFITTFIFRVTPKLLYYNNITGRDQLYLIKNKVMSLRTFVATKG